jgi:hypothetical protein
MTTDHPRGENVKRYAGVQLDAKRKLLEGNFVYSGKKFNLFVPLSKPLFLPRQFVS